MTKEEIKKWIEDHKEPIIIGIKLVGAIAMAVIIGKAISKTKEVPMEVIYDMPPVKDIPKAPDIPMGLIKHGVSEWDIIGTGVLEFMLPYAQPDSRKYPTKLKDIYEILDALKDVPGITDDTDVWAQFSISRDNT